MKSVIVAALLVVAATVIGAASSVRAKKDVGSKNSNGRFVYADVSKTGKRTFVGGDPAPTTLAVVLQRQSAAAGASRVHRGPLVQVVHYKSPCSRYGDYPCDNYSGGGYRMAEGAYPMADLTWIVVDADEMADSDGVYEDDTM